MKKNTKNTEETAPSGISRKDAIKKMGKYAALSTISTFIILDPKKAQASSASPIPSDGGSGGENPTEDPPSPSGWGI